MPDKMTGSTWVSSTGERVKSYAGSESGKDTKYDETQREEARERFRRAKGWDGIAGARKAPVGQEFERQLDSWLDEQKAKKTGQAAALGTMK